MCTRGCEHLRAETVRMHVLASASHNRFVCGCESAIKAIIRDHEPVIIKEASDNFCKQSMGGDRKELNYFNYLNFGGLKAAIEGINWM